MLCCIQCGTFTIDTTPNGSRSGYGYRGALWGEVPSVAAVQPTMNKATSLGTIHISQTIFRSNGVAGFYAGLYPSLIMPVPNTVTYFSCYDEVVSRMKQWRRRQRLQRRDDFSDNYVDAKENFYFDQIRHPSIKD